MTPAKITLNKSLKMLVAGMVFFTSLPSLAAELNFSVEKGRFLVEGLPVPSGCLQRLMTELNGDDVTRSVYLTRSSVRGCMNANNPGREINYKIVEDKGDGVYQVQLCEPVEGSMGTNCATLIMRVSIYSYILRKEVKSVLAIDKLGEK